MKKYLNKIIIGVTFVLVFAGTQVSDFLLTKDIQEQEITVSVPKDIPKDYIVSNSIELHVNKDIYVDTDDSTITGVLKEIVYIDSSIDSLIIETKDLGNIEFFCDTMDLISADTTKTKQEHGIDEVRLAFRTGKNINLVKNENVELYEKVSGMWSLDSREHIKSANEEFAGKIVDFKFLPMVDQQGDVFVSYMTVENKDGQRAQLYFYNMNTTSIKSNGELQIYYVGSITDSYVYDVRESKDFSIGVVMKDGESYTLKRDTQIKLVRNENKGYWEIGKDIDTTRYEAKVTDFVFGHSGENITSMDYIMLSIDESADIPITMMQTQALYAVPYGNYKKIYTYNGHDKEITDIEPLEDWSVELVYQDDTILSLKVGTTVWIYKNDDDIWIIDYTIVPVDADEEQST